MGPLSIASAHYNRVILGLVLLFLVHIFGTVGYMVVEGWSFLDAFYMSAITITTVGYREVHPLSRAGELFTIVHLFLGVGTAFYILTTLGAAIIEGDLRQVFGARRMRLTIERVKDHFIICGYGRVGEEIARELRDRQVPFVIIDRELGALEPARDDGLLVVQGDATRDDVLLAAGVTRCQALIAASESDATNTYITLTAKSLRPDVFVVARVSSPDLEAKLRQAGANRVVSPYAIGGRRLALAALQPIIIDFIDLLPSTQGERILAELAVDDTAGLVGRTLNDALAGCEDVVVLAVRNAAGDLSVGPPRSTVISAGDQLLVIGDEVELRSFGGEATGKIKTS